MRRHRGPEPIGECPRNQKKQYPSEEVAREAAKALRKRTGPRTKPYVCPHCQLWHIGHDRAPQFRKGNWFRD